MGEVRWLGLAYESMRRGRISYSLGFVQEMIVRFGCLFWQALHLWCTLGKRILRGYLTLRILYLEIIKRAKRWHFLQTTWNCNNSNFARNRCHFAKQSLVLSRPRELHPSL